MASAYVQMRWKLRSGLVAIPKGYGGGKALLENLRLYAFEDETVCGERIRRAERIAIPSRCPSRYGYSPVLPLMATPVLLVLALSSAGHGGGACRADAAE